MNDHPDTNNFCSLIVNTESKTNRNETKTRVSSVCSWFKMKLCSPALIMHCISAPIWMFLTIFGGVMEIDHLSSCDSEEACQAMLQDRTSAFRVINLVGVSLGIAQASLILSSLVYRLTFSLHGVVFLIKPEFHIALFVPLTSAFMYVYQYFVYGAMFDCSAFLSHSYHPSPCGKAYPPEHWTVRNIYMIVLVFGSVTTLIYIILISYFAWVFVTNRRKTWNRITATEDTLFLTPDLTDMFEGKNVLKRTSRIANFVTKWGTKSDQDIIETLNRRASTIMNILVRVLDTNGSSPSSFNLAEQSMRFADFAEYARSAGLHDVEHHHQMWHILSSHCENDAKDKITVKDIENLLYELFFDRKQLANSINTDKKMMRYMLTYALAILFPLCGIIGAKIFNYRDAFGNGIDLFKTYAVIISYVFSNMMSSLRFVSLMISKRPFNVGDVIKYDNEIYEVEDFDTSHVMLSGSTSRIVANQVFMNESIINLTQNSMSDNFDIGLPYISNYDTTDMQAAIDAYIKQNPRDIDKNSIRVGWVDANDRTKILRLNWRYKFRIFDRTRLVTARTRIMNHLFNHCNKDIKHAAMIEYVAGGGGLNDMYAGDNYVKTKSE